MGRAPCCSKDGLHRGPWTPREDTLLTKYIQFHGEGHWRSMPKKAGLLRCGKSCRLRWMNYLRPDIKRGNISVDEDDLIIRMHSLLGNRWSLIAGRLPGRTDNEIKNYWNTHLSKRLRSQGTDPNTHKKITDQPTGGANDGTRKKRDVTSSMKKQKQGKSTDPDRPKVHLPKPVRFTSLSLPRNLSFESNTNNSASSSHGGEGVDGNDDGLSCDIEAGLPWSAIDIIKSDTDHGDHHNNLSNFLIGDDDALVHNSSFLEYQSHVPESSNVDKIYEEYWELLKTDDEQLQSLDSFAESLLL